MTGPSASELAADQRRANAAAWCALQVSHYFDPSDHRETRDFVVSLLKKLAQGYAPQRLELARLNAIHPYVWREWPAGSTSPLAADAARAALDFKLDGDTALAQAETAARRCLEKLAPERLSSFAAELHALVA